MVTSFVQLSIVLAGDEPPNEFRIFTAGIVDTAKGQFIFDQRAAESVLADYAKQGNELMVDYDHASLSTGVAPDPAQAGKAAAWFDLQVRNGELWAVNVRWTPPAAEALRRKEWRYMSPAFETDADGRIVSLMNVAITNLPATRKLQPLMAANLMRLSMLDADMVKKALDALKNGDAEACMALLTDMIAAAASGESPSDAPAEDPAADPAAEVPASESSDAPVEETQAVAAALSTLSRLTNKTSLGEQVAEVEIWRASHLKLEAETSRLAKERAALELAKRKENAVALTKLGAETPATTGLAKGKLCKRLVDEPLDEQTERVAVLLAAKGGRYPSPPLPPTAPAESSGLSERELAICAEMGVKPEVYAANKLRRSGAAV